ncbi:MAG: hypothetical protein HY908_13065 [Myxococcales bacterium]|nr:hypothetical protein [Myxococcales bacterium]
MNPDLATRLLDEFCTAGHTDACAKLGTELVFGANLFEDVTRGMGLLDRACGGEHASAFVESVCILLADLFEGGTPPQECKKDAVPTACRLRAKLVEIAYAVEPNPERARAIQAFLADVHDSRELARQERLALEERERRRDEEEREQWRQIGAAMQQGASSMLEQMGSSSGPSAPTALAPPVRPAQGSSRPTEAQPSLDVTPGQRPPEQPTASPGTSCVDRTACLRRNPRPYSPPSPDYPNATEWDITNTCATTVHWRTCPEPLGRGSCDAGFLPPSGKAHVVSLETSSMKFWGADEDAAERCLGY